MRDVLAKSGATALAVIVVLSALGGATAVATTATNVDGSPETVDGSALARSDSTTASTNVTLNGQTGEDAIVIESMPMRQGGYIALTMGRVTGPATGTTTYLGPGGYVDRVVKLDRSANDSTVIYAVAVQTAGTSNRSTS